MYKKELNQFFKKNSVKDSSLPSASALAHFKIKLMTTPETNEKIERIMNEMVFKEQSNREESAMGERAEMEALSTCAEITKYMRRSHDPINQNALVSKALELEDETVPEIIRMLKTSLNTPFIESATRVLSLCGKDIADELVACFDDIRNPYAQSMTMLVIGFKGTERHIPWLMEKYAEFKRKYPDETYSDSAYYALGEIEERIYPV